MPNSNFSNEADRTEQYPERPLTRAEADIEQRIDEVHGDDERQLVLERARTFKSGWVDLAAVLSKVAKQQSYKEWGYKTLEAYCLKELHIRKPTVSKLIGNYHFLKKNEPNLIENTRLEQIPDMETTRALANIRENSRVDEETYNRLKEGALDRGYTAATINRKAKLATTSPEQRKQDELLRRLNSMIHNIKVVFAHLGNMPDEIREALQKLESHVQSRMEAVSSETPVTADETE